MAEGSPFGSDGATWFLLRTPLLPFEEVLSPGIVLEAPLDPTDEGARKRDRTRIRERMAALLERPEIKEAIFVASPSLSDALRSWEQDADGAAGRRVERALVRYLSRMATRSTPFGLFAACTFGRVGEALAEVAVPVQRRARLDAHYLDALVQALAQDPGIRSEVRFEPNASLQKFAGRMRYVESVLEEDGRRYRLSTVEANEHVAAVLERAEGGALLSDLVARLVGVGVSKENAIPFVDEMVAEQLLLPDLQVPVTGAPPVDQLVEDLAALPSAKPAAQALRSVRDRLVELNEEPVGMPAERYREVVRELDALPAEVDPARLFQVDATRAGEVRLPEVAMAELLRGAETLRRLQPRGEPRELRAFRDAFLERYDQAEVPLIEALDDEIGVGFGPRGGPSTSGSPLLRDLSFPSPGDDSTEWTEGHRLIFRRALEAIERGDSEAKISRAEIAALPDRAPLPLPDAFDVFGAIAASSQEAVDRGDFQAVIYGVSGPSGARLLGRFCHVDGAIADAVRGHLGGEEAHEPDSVYAEIVHLSQGRLANILFRPILRGYEIEYLGRSGAPRDRRLPASDLMVSIRPRRDALLDGDERAVADDAAGGREIVLRSRRLDRIVRPRLTSAHAFGGRTLPVYRFLCSLQSSGVEGELFLDLGPLSEAPFVPRIVVGRAVLSRARWRLGQEEIVGLTAGTDPFARVQDLRSARRLPRLVSVVDRDNKLVVDLDNVLSVESFVHLIGRSEFAVLEEVFPGPDDLWVRSDAGRHASEVVVPFIRKGPSRTSRVPPVTGTVRRHLPPGSDWLFARIPTAESLADWILLDTVAPLAARLIKEGVVDRWFFIRYWDPDFHLRVRFHGDPSALHDRVLPALQRSLEPLLFSGAVRSPTLNTYEREVERYGGAEAIEVAEQIFHIDSEAVVEILGMLEPGDQGLDERWRIGLAGAVALAADLGLDLRRRERLFTGLARAFTREFAADTALKKKMGRGFRDLRATLLPLVTGDIPHDHPLAPGMAVLRQRSERLAGLADQLQALEASGPTAAPVSSYIHMHLNRILRSHPRAHEMVIYEHLSRLHRELLARGG